MRAALKAARVSDCWFAMHTNGRSLDRGSDMRKLLFGLGVVFAFIIAAGAGGMGMVLRARPGSALDAESAAYVRNSVVSIASDWNADELWSRSSARFRQARPNRTFVTSSMSRKVRSAGC